MFNKATLRPPNPEDGIQVHKLIAACPPLDTNSSYCNLLQCTHFSETSVIAELENEVVGFVSGYIPPQKPETLFIWQVAVGEQARGKGLAYKMIKEIISRLSNKGSVITHLETSITKDNAASWAMFESLAKQLQAETDTSVLFDEQLHFSGSHHTEHLLRIGPIKTN